MRDAAANPRVERVLVFVKGDNPTFDYYLRSRLADFDEGTVVIRSVDDDSRIETRPDGLFVVVCRYVRRRQLSWLEKNRDRLAGLALLVDDDMPAIVAGNDGAAAYRLYIAYFGCWPLRRLNRLLSDVWVSTAHLQRLLAGRGIAARLLPPRPVLGEQSSVDRNDVSDGVAIAFHATDIHGREHRFLVPIVEAVLKAHPDARFEVLARGANRRLWEGADIESSRIAIRPLLTWPIYVEATRERGCDILLVPLLDSRINAARSDTKRIDACRMGAAPIFSDGAVYARKALPGEALVANDAESWIAAIGRMITDPDERRRAASYNRAAVAAMAKEWPASLCALFNDQSRSLGDATS